MNYTTPKPPPLFATAERDARDTALDAHEANYGQVLDELRGRMRSLYRVRAQQYGQTAYVTADDARVVLDTLERYADLPNRNFMGQLYREQGWQFTGQRIKSKTPGSHSNELKCWRWVGGGA